MKDQVEETVKQAADGWQVENQLKVSSTAE
jgi:hypothetical protein